MWQEIVTKQALRKEHGSARNLPSLFGIDDRPTHRQTGRAGHREVWLKSTTINLGVREELANFKRFYMIFFKYLMIVLNILMND